jgi:hypothetical protein
MRHGRGNWTIEIPSDWELIDHDECVTLERPEGALQFSSMSKDKGNFDLTEVEKVAARCGSKAWGSFEQVRAGELSGIVFCYLDGDVRWYRWFLAKGAVFVFVTYNSEVEPSEKIKESFAQVMNSLRIAPIRPNNLINRTANALRALVAGYR